MSEKAASRRSSNAGSPAAAASSPPAVTEGQITAHLDVEIDAEDVGKAFTLICVCSHG